MTVYCVRSCYSSMFVVVAALRWTVSELVPQIYGDWSNTYLLLLLRPTISSPTSYSTPSGARGYFRILARPISVHGCLVTIAVHAEK